MIVLAVCAYVRDVIRELARTFFELFYESE